MVPLFVMMILPFLNGSFDSANLDEHDQGDRVSRWGGLQLALVWLWLMCWSAWGVDVCATFAPEYKDTARDTKLALRSAALFSMVVYILLPIGFVGGGTAQARRAPTTTSGRWTRSSARRASRTSSSSASIASFIITMNTATADGGRALYGISRDGMTIKQLGRLNRFNVPGNAMTRRHGRQHPLLSSSSATSSASSRRATSATCSRTCSRSPASCCSAGTGRTGRDRSSSAAIWTPIAGLLAVWCLILTIVGFGWMQVGGGRLRRHEGEDHRGRRCS